MAANKHLTITDVYHMFLQIVKDYPYSECNQIRTFAQLNNQGGFFRSSWLSDNLDKTYNDYLNGFFWARDWVAGGANMSKLSKEYPVLGIEYRSAEFDDLKNSFACNEFYLVVADRYDCADCSEQCKRTHTQISVDTQKMLFNVLKEFNTYALYSWQVAGEDFEGWLSEGRVQYLIANALIDAGTLRDLGPTICNSLNYKPVKYVDWGLSDSTYDKVLGWAVKFDLCDCFIQDATFVYNKEEAEPRGTTACETC